MIDVAVKGIIVNGDKVLLLKRSSMEDCYKNLWETPGGKINFGENLKEALKREVKEETNLDIEVFIPVNTWSFFRDDKSYVVGITFLCKPLSEKIRLSEEHVEYRWIAENELDELEMNENLRKELKFFFKNKNHFLNIDPTFI